MLLTGLPLPSSTPAPSIGSTAGRVEIWTGRDEPYRRGEGARVYLRTDEPAHVTVFRVDTDGRLRVLFPHEPWGDTYVRDRREFELSGSRGGRSFIVDDYPGVGYLFAIASRDPFDYQDITRGDYWDYRLVDGGRLRGDPYVFLTDLADRIAGGGDYDYDIAPYYVDRRYDYPRFVCYDCHAYAAYDEWNPYERACSEFRLVVYDDPRYYPYRYNRGRNVVADRLAHPGPRYVFRDADPRSEYVTRLQRRRPDEPARTSDDVGGQGSVPAPGTQSLGRRTVRERQLEPPSARPLDRERLPGDAERPQDAGKPRKRKDDGQPNGLKPQEGERRIAPPRRPARPPESTGEPELRRRRP
jgi:hypothetical protein